MDSKAPKLCNFPGHTGVVSAWCQTCHTFVCVQGMVSELHSGHVFVALEKIAEEHRTTIEKKKEKIQKMVEDMNALLAHQEEIETKFNESIDDISTSVDERSQSFISEIESWKAKTKSLLQKKAEENKECMTICKNKIKEDQNKLQKALDCCNHENYETSVAMVDEVILTKLQSSVYSPTRLSLRDGNAEKIDIDAMLGKISDEDTYGSDCSTVDEPNTVTNSKDVTTQPNSTVKTVGASTEISSTDNPPERIYSTVNPSDDVEILDHSKFQCTDQKGKTIKLAATRDDGVWVTWSGTKCLKYFDDKGNSRKRIVTDFEICDIGVNSKNELLASVNNGSRIKRKIFIGWTSIVRTEPLVTYGIDITPTDEILVCLQAIDHGEIGIFSPTGEKLHSIRLDQNTKEIFKRPRQLCKVGPTGDVLVIVDGALIVLDKDGNVKKAWRGELDSDTDKEAARSSWQPVSLARTSDADLFVLDHGNRRIVVFDKLGEFLGVMNDNVMLENMNAVVFDKKGQMWVACTDGNIHTAKLRIHRETKTDSHL